MNDLKEPVKRSVDLRAWAVNLLALALAAGLATSCGRSHGNSAPAQPKAAGELMAWSPAGTLNAATLNGLISSAGISGITATNDVSCYKLTYGTPDVAGTLIRASGLVCLPAVRTGTHPVVSYQHGTIFLDSEAPSSFTTSLDALIGAVFAGMGYFAVLPDYIGYGDSSGLLHPYLHAATLASATIDMNRAARAFFNEPGINAATNGQLFLAGYSAGGFATMAAQRTMEQSLAAEFPVTASEPGAGPYDMTGTTRTILGRAAQPQPEFSAFFVKAYDAIYNPQSEIAYYFTAAYAPIVNTYFNGSYSRSQITSALGGANVATDTLFNPVFVASFLGAGETGLKTAIAGNDIYNWAPGVPTRLFHGQNDDVVPYANAVTAHAAMAANGSTTVTVVDCNAGGLPTTHDNCAMPFAVDVVSFFKTLATGI